MHVGGHLPSQQFLRRSELILATVVIVSHVFFWGFGGIFSIVGRERLGEVLSAGLLTVFFSSPILLGLCVLSGVLIDDVGIGTLIAVGLAALAIYVTYISVHVLIFPVEGGGVYGGHIFTSLTMALFVPAVVLRRMVDRLFARLWLYERTT